MTAWLSVVGVGDDGVSGMTPAARAIVEGAEIIVGAERLLDGLSRKGRELHGWASPLSETVARIEGWRGRKVAVLASGDPMHFGVGCTLARHIPVEEMRVVPAPSAFSLAAARLGWPLQEVECLSLHGRPAELILPLVAPGVRILALTGGAETVRKVADLLRRQGFGASRLYVLEHMGGEAERGIALSAEEVSEQPFAEFNLLAIECVADPGAVVLPRAPGLPDEAFHHDGQITKREIRAVTLAALSPLPGALLWDVGAGCGSIAIEWMRAARGVRAIAFERDKDRISLIGENAAGLGVPDLEIVAGDAPETLQGRSPPDVLFHGGAVSDEAVFDACWSALPRGGRLVANSVTLEGEAALIARHGRFGGDLVRIDVAHLFPIGGKRGLQPRMSVLQWRAVKGAGS
jgi:precorrin-6B C5,15-methyltransferase / cobalt-precorrin-6B C5,C15-methyltransferase